MSKNSYTISSLSDFSTSGQIANALTGKWGNTTKSGYQLTIWKNAGMAIVFPGSESVDVTLPSHKAFSYLDISGNNIFVDSSTTSLSVQRASDKSVNLIFGV